MDQTASAHQTLLGHFREYRQNPNFDRRRRLRARRDHQKGTPLEGIAAYVATDSPRDAVRKSLTTTNACGNRSRLNQPHLVNQLTLFDS